jgi:threonine/homoserine/homoserine lactone efflux protein
MNSIQNFDLFLLSSFLIIALPGQDFIYVTTRGVALGKKAGVLSAIGISVGLLVHTLLAACGLSIILNASEVAYRIIQYMGAAYLVYIGVQTLRSKDEMFTWQEVREVRAQDIFLQGILTNVFNPKALIVFVAFLPQFIDMKVSGSMTPFFILGGTLALIAIIWFSIVGLFAGMIGVFVKTNKYFQRVIKYAAGSILIGLGIRLALEKK